MPLPAEVQVVDAAVRAAVNGAAALLRRVALLRSSSSSVSGSDYSSPELSVFPPGEFIALPHSTRRI
jgi:hypothetical protein